MEKIVSVLNLRDTAKNALIFTDNSMERMRRFLNHGISNLKKIDELKALFTITYN
jgi:hypothetical protein